MGDVNIVVLGSRVVDGKVDALLASRLARAEALVEKLDHAGKPPLVVVSGRGEAPAMRDWLVARGMDPARIIVEPEATSTNENLEKAQALFPDTRQWLVVTNDFHAVRTRLWAWHLDVPVRVVTARTPRRRWWPTHLRELVAKPHSALRVLWRRLRG